jgi:uncharacterized protein (DUF58 family)
MKKLVLFTFMLFAAVFSAMAQNDTQAAKPVITFEESTHDFGDIAQGEKVSHVFKFKNTGSAPLILQNVQTTCGCTATDWPRDPVAPGKSGQITASFNSAGKMGKQNKVITVISNASNSPERVSIVTNILPKQAEAAKPVAPAAPVK